MEPRMSPNGTRDYLISLKARLKDAVKEELIKNTPFRNFKIPVKQEQEITTLDGEEVKKLVVFPFPPYPQLRLAFLFSCFTGLRVSDVRALRWQDLHEMKSEDGTPYKVLKIKPVKTEKTMDKYIALPLTVPAMKVLEETSELTKAEKEPEEKVFDHLPGESRSRDLLKLWAARAGIKKMCIFMLEDIPLQHFA